MKTDITWLIDQLPAIEKIKLRSEPDYYGVSRIISNQLGYKKTPRSFAQWLHGWIFTEPITDPRELTFWGKPNDRILVTTEIQVETLRQFGYHHVYATGLPFIYANTNAMERKSNSLLVMPSHSTAYNEQFVNQEKYVKSILDLKPDYDHITFCLHGCCVEKKYWIPTLEKYEIPWIIGASTNDCNALTRINRILQSFESMTSNVMGSHIAYASASGCRVSIAGEYASPKAEEYRNDPWYQKYPELLKKHLSLFQEKEIKQRFSHFFQEPKDSTTHVEWGNQMIGKKYQRTASELSEILGWSNYHQIQGYLSLVKNNFFSSLSRRFTG